MKIYILSDNFAGRNCKAEWGLSYYIESNKNILFDFGASQLFLDNARKLNLNLSGLDYGILSHGHWDHGNGLEFIEDNINLVCHPEVFLKRYSGDEYIGLPFSKQEGEKKFNLIYSKTPYQLDEKIFFLGEIPRTNDFEAKKTIFHKEDNTPDFVMDDTGLVFITSQGLIVISGCAHAGICNTIEYAKEVTGVEKVYAAIGGFHLDGGDKITERTIAYLKEAKVVKVIPTHCTKFPALVEFAQNFASKQVYTGQILEFAD